MKIREIRNRVGFTLIELLVVIAIIALLLSITMPALRLAKDHAKKIVCSANLRSLSTAALLYSEENDMRPPVASNHWSDDDVERAGWCGTTMDASRELYSESVQLNGDGTSKVIGLVNGQLWPYIESADVWRCAADPDKENLRSYCMTAQWWSTHSTPKGEDKRKDSVYYDSGAPGNIVIKKMSQLRNAGSRLLFVDQLGYNKDAYFALKYSVAEWWNIPGYLHNGGSVNSFADGHVEAYKLSSATVKICEDSWEEAMQDNNDYFLMLPENATYPDSEDLAFYQRGTWGKIVR